MTYHFVQGIDYGPRQGTLGLSYHMSEGGDGLVGFLARHSGESLTDWKRRVNGVSCNAAILSTGEIVQMLDWGHASGNLNPDDRADEYGYYGGHHLRDVLGSHWPDPNTWTVSAELAGYRAKGPTDAQVVSAIWWGNEMKARFPTIRGATGHHDQSPKPCPGLTANMKAIFTGVGGHGRWQEEADMVPAPISDRTPALVDVAPGADWYDLDNKTVIGPGVDAAIDDRLSPFGVGTIGQGGRRAIFVTLKGLSRLALVTPTAVQPTSNCADVVAAQREHDRTAVLSAVEEVFA